MQFSPDISFEKATFPYKDLLLVWHEKAHVKEFWDNSQNQRKNVINYLQGKKDIFDYWIGFIENKPYSLLMTSDCTTDSPEVFKPYLSKTGKTFSIDFMIGEEAFLGKGLGSITLKAFINFLRKNIDPMIHTFIIDPAETNPRAIHVYEKAGFKKVQEFTPQVGFFKGIYHFLMIQEINT